jgi:glucose/arabinose dehydrogenase
MRSLSRYAALGFTIAALAACGADFGGGLSLGPVAVRLDPAYPLLSPFDRPVLVTPIPGTGQVAVVEQGGRIRAFDDRDDVLDTDMVMFLDINGRVVSVSGTELGLLGLAFDPDFANNRRFYVNYTTDRFLPAQRRVTVISRFTAVGGVGDPNSETILLEYDQPFDNNNGGMLAFGPDGLLYVASGDGGSFDDPDDNAQNLNSLLGKILRITTTQGAIVPPDNPFVGQANTRGEIWAFGLRNPWRFSFDRGTGRMWIGDVGEDALEEIDLGARGANYGWRVFEGSRSNINPTGIPASAFTAPTFEYGRSFGQSIVGGYVYRGSAIPGLAGRYVYADFISGRIWGLTLDGTVAVANEQIATTVNPSSFGETAAGELLVVSYTGSVLRLVPDI